MRLGARPDGWRADLQDAVHLGDFGRITTLIEQIADSDAALAAALGTWAYNFDLDSFALALAAGRRIAIEIGRN